MPAMMMKMMMSCRVWNVKDGSRTLIKIKFCLQKPFHRNVAQERSGVPSGRRRKKRRSSKEGMRRRGENLSQASVMC